MSNEIEDIDEAIDFLSNNTRLDIEEITHKWEVTSQDSKNYKAEFYSDKELINFANEEKDKIEEAED